MPGDSERDETAKKPTNPIVAYAGLIAAIAGLISSYTAHTKATQEQVARDSYKTTTLAIERLSDESQINHADIVALRQYLVDHVATGPTQGPPNPSAMAPADSLTPPIIRERHRPVVVSKTAGGGAKGASADLTLTSPISAEVKSPPAPPAPARMPDEWPE